VKKILVIDDERDIIDYLTIFLEESGYEAYGVDDPYDALDVMERYCPDLMLIDIMMPRKTGFALYQTIKTEKRFKHIPVFFVSALTRGRDFPEEQLERLLKEYDLPPPTGFIEKPINRDELLETIENVLSSEAPSGTGNDDGH